MSGQSSLVNTLQTLQPKVAEGSGIQYFHKSIKQTVSLYSNAVYLVVAFVPLSTGQDLISP